MTTKEGAVVIPKEGGCAPIRKGGFAPFGIIEKNLLYFRLIILMEFSLA
jgi:hypothetical protein